MNAVRILNRYRRATAAAATAGLALASALMIAVAACGGTSGGGNSGTGTSGSTASRGPSTGASSSSIATAQKACSVITAAEIDQVMGSKFPAPKAQSVGTYYQCSTQNAAGVQVGIAVPPQAPGGQGSVTAFRNGEPKGATNLSGVGQAAYCTSLGLAGKFVISINGTTIVEVTADTCAHAAALARIVWTRV